jgi:hypothetical protein
MIEVAVWLVVVGLCDLVRAARDATSWSRRLLMAGIGAALLTFGAVALDVSGWRVGVLLGGWVAFFLLWLLGSAAALAGAGGAARAVAFTGLGGGLLFGLLGADLLAAVEADVPAPFSGHPLDQLVLVLGVTLVQLATANVAVRLVLDAVGVPAATNEKRLKGGRMLGPMERLFVVGLGVAGQLTAASIVVAAKGLLRFPELQRGAAHDGPSDITEYFLIGSFSSWLFALGGLGLLALG